jgi:hypothetical protein
LKLFGNENGDCAFIDHWLHDWRLLPEHLVAENDQTEAVIGQAFVVYVWSFSHGVSAIVFNGVNHHVAIS